MRKVLYVVLAQAALALSILAWAVHPAWALAFVVAPVGLLGRRPGGSRATELLSAVRPGAFMTSVDVDGVDAGVVEDADGLAVMIQVGALSDLLGDAPPPLPPLSTLLPPPAPDLPETRVQLLISATAAPDHGGSPSTVSYRQLTDGKVLARQRVLLCVRVRRAGGYQREDLERSLVAAVRRACRQLAKARLPAHPLSSPAALAALAETARHRPGGPIRGTRHGTRRGLELDGLHQAVFRLRRWRWEGPLATDLLTLPCTAVSVSLTAAADDQDTCRAELTIRLAAPTRAALDQAAAALHRLATTHEAAFTRQPGTQLDALAATLPLGGGAPSRTVALAGLLTGRDDLTPDGTPAHPVTAAELAALQPTPAPSGLMLGRNRQGAPVVVHPFRTEPTRAVLIGGPRCAQLLTLRALAVGAHITIQSTRPDTWSPLLRALTGEQITLLPPGQPRALPSPTPTHPQLLILDPAHPPATRPRPHAAGLPAGLPAGLIADAAFPPAETEAPWRATLVIRDNLTPSDTDLLTQADLVFLQLLTPPEAAIATAVLGLTASASWLTRIPPEMLGTVVNHHTVRWTHLSPTPIELQLTGRPTR